MSDPIATPDDLATFLGVSVDDDRATMLLGIAQAYCEDVVSPLPGSAFGVVLAAAARAYTNPQQAANVTLGPAAFSQTASVYLTRAERATLRQAAGRQGGGSTSVLQAPVNAVQTLTVVATAGTFKLSYAGASTPALAFNASAADVQAALQALPTVGADNVTVSGSYVVTFVNNLGGQPVSTIVADASSLTGTASVVVTAAGVSGAGANLPPWDYDYSPPRSW